MKFKVLIENTALDERFICEHGLSFWIEFEGKNYLLDSGSTAAFMKNAKLMNVDLEEANYVLLSHCHYDHSGGFVAFLEKYPDKKVMASHQISQKFYSTSRGSLHEVGVQEALMNNQQHVMPLQEDICLCENVFFVCLSDLNHIYQTGLYDQQMKEDSFSHEYTLVFQTKQGLVLFNSCSHAHPITIVEAAKKRFANEKIYAYVGGLHLKGIEDKGVLEDEVSRISAYFKDIFLYTGHCTGQEAYDLLEKSLKSQLYPLTSGIEYNL